MSHKKSNRQQSKLYSTYLQENVLDYYRNMVLRAKEVFMRYSKATMGKEKLSLTKEFAMNIFFENLLSFDFAPIVNSPYADYMAYIEEHLRIYYTQGLVERKADAIFAAQMKLTHQADVNTQKAFYALLSALSDVLTAIDNIYEIFNSLAFVIPYRRFDVEPLLWSRVNPILEKAQKAGIDTMLFNIEREDGFHSLAYKLSRADWKMFETERCGSDPLPDATVYESVWKLTRISDDESTKEILLIPFVEDTGDKISKANVMLNHVAKQCLKDLDYKQGVSGNESLTAQYCDAKSHHRAFFMSDCSGVDNTVDTTVDVIRIPFLKFFSREEKDEISYVFQALDCFLSRKKIYKNKDFSKITKNRTTKDVGIVDKDAKDIIAETSSSGIVQIKDIVVYETSYGKRYHTHHKHPRRHYVRPHERVSKNGKVSKIPGFWRGGTEDNKDNVIYRV